METRSSFRQKDETVREIRAQYKRQQELAKFVNARALARPNVSKAKTIMCFVIWGLGIIGTVLFGVLAKINSTCKAMVLTLSIILHFEFALRCCLIVVIKYYQHVAKEETRKRCKCIPSCSEYSLLCLKRIYPLFVAFAKISRRLFYTCDGKEYKIDFPTKRQGRKFEEKNLHL